MAGVPDLQQRPLMDASTAQLNELLRAAVSPEDPQGGVLLTLQLTAINELIQRGQGNYDSLMQFSRILQMDPRPFIPVGNPQAPHQAIRSDVNYVRQAAAWGLSSLNAWQNPGKTPTEAIGLEAYEEVLKRPWEDPSVQTAVAQAARSLIRPGQPMDPQLRRVFQLASGSCSPNVREQAQAGLATTPFDLPRQ